MIEQKYLLVMMIPCYIDEAGVRRVEPLWHKDLIKHLDQIADLTLAAPARHEPPIGPYLAIEPDPSKGTLSYVDLPPCRSTLSALLTLPKAAIQLWKAIGKAEIVHVNAGGWPISYGWIAAPMARLRGKFVLTNIESGGWRLGLQRPWKFKGLVQGVVFETLARFIVNLSHMATFTHAGYLDEMLFRSRRDRGHVVSASWIDESVILPLHEAEALWDAKLDDPDRALDVVFAGNLLPSKGIPVLLDALALLDERGVRLNVHIYGKGYLADACEAAARRMSRTVSLTMEGMLAYGPEFFEMLRRMDVMVTPSISDEQPRVVYDAFSQAVPVVASATTGLKQNITDGRDGILFPPGDALALADALARAAAERPRLRDMGIAALDVARALTHDEMHARRAALIQSALAERAGGKVEAQAL